MAQEIDPHPASHILEGKCKVTIGLRIKNRDIENYFEANNYALQAILKILI